MVDCTCNNNHACPTTEAGPVYKLTGICTQCVVYCIVVFLNANSDPLHTLETAMGFLGTVVKQFHTMLHRPLG